MKECKSKEKSTKIGIKTLCAVPGPTKNMFCDMVKNSLNDLVCPMDT